MKIAATFILIFLTQFDLLCQDEILYMNGGHEYVDQIDSLQSDFLYYTSFGIRYKAPLPLISGYHTMIRTEKNLKRKFHKRKRVYHDTRTDTTIHISDFEATYINTKLPERLSDPDYADGYYVLLNGDTTFSEIALLRSINDRSLLCIARKNEEYIILSAREIRAYSVNEEVYRGLAVINEYGHPTYQFAFTKVAGTLSLLHKHPSVFDGREYSLLIKKGSHTLYPIDIANNNSVLIRSDEGIMETQRISMNMIEVSFKEKNLDNSFKELMPPIIIDCPQVANKVKSEFYTKSDLMRILSEYNNCNK